jgi:hypothetical protein
MRIVSAKLAKDLCQAPEFFRIDFLPSHEFVRLLDNDCVHLPGRLQGTGCLENHNAGPVKCNALILFMAPWDGRETHAYRCPQAHAARRG